MTSHAFAVDLTGQSAEAATTGAELPEGLDREVVFEQTAGAGRWLVVYQEGTQAGQVTSLRGVLIPPTRLVLEAAPLTLPAAQLYAFAVPLLPGRTQEWLEFCADISGPRRAELLAQRERVHLAERVFLQTGEVDFVIPVIRGDRPEEEDHLIAATGHPFDSWFIARLAYFHGFDPAAPPPPRNTLILDLSRSRPTAAPRGVQRRR